MEADDIPHTMTSDVAAGYTRTSRKRLSDGSTKSYKYNTIRKTIELTFSTETEKVQFEQKCESIRLAFGCKRVKDALMRAIMNFNISTTTPASSTPLQQQLLIMPFAMDHVDGSASQLDQGDGEAATDLEAKNTGVICFTGKKMAESHENAHEAVLGPSGKLPVEPVVIKGYDFNNGVNYPELLKSFYTTGFQATNVAKAIDEINRMINKKQEPLPEDAQLEINLNPCLREKTSCTIFLGYTSNMISSGVRETIRFLAEHNLIDCIVTTAGGVEEDFIKCLAPTFLGEFTLSGKDLRDRGINRIGNLLAPNNNYCKFEDWVMPILDKLVEEQKGQGITWTPSKVIARLGKEIDNPESVYYWCYKNNIPVFCPALTDGSLGDMIYFHSYKNPGLVIDIVEDIRRINQMAIYSLNSGIIILGGGVVKHHICNANLMRNGADYSVYINTAQEFDGSDAGASPDEAVSWGKIKKTANPVKVYGEASIIFPLVVAETFAKPVKAGIKQEPIEQL